MCTLQFSLCDVPLQAKAAGLTVANLAPNLQTDAQSLEQQLDAASNVFGVNVQTLTQASGIQHAPSPDENQHAYEAVEVRFLLSTFI